MAGADGVELSCLDLVAAGEHFVVLAFADAHEAPSSVLFSLSASGVRDPVFGDGGLLDLGPDVTASGLVVDARGRVLVAKAAHYAARVVAFGADGRPELTFGDATGKLAIPLAGIAAARNVRLLSDGRILVGGSLVDPSGERWFVAAFLP